jgi:hypothetical protein
MPHDTTRGGAGMNWISFMAGAAAGACFALVAAFVAVLWLLGAACQVCGSSGSNRRLSVDHDHTSGKVRGLLCASCNFAIGNMGDDPDKLRAAANYLEETRV